MMGIQDDSSATGDLDNWVHARASPGTRVPSTRWPAMSVRAGCTRPLARLSRYDRLSSRLGFFRAIRSISSAVIPAAISSRMNVR